MPIQTTSDNNHKFITANLDTETARLNSKHLNLKILEVITTVAVAAILITAFALSLAGIALTGPSSYILGGLVLATVPLAFGIVKISEKANKCLKQAKTAKAIAQIAKDKDLRPIDARIFFSQQKIDKKIGDISAYRNNKDTDPLIRHTYCQARWESKLQHLKLKLKHAVLLELKENPTLESHKLKNLGAIMFKPYDLYHYDKKNGNTDFFTFNNNKAPLTAEFIKTNSFDKIRQALFAPRAPA